MNIVDFFENQVQKWNDELKCGLCWTFDAPLTKSALNAYQPESGKECCVHVLIVRDEGNAFSTVNSYNETTSLKTGVLCNTSFQLYIVLDSKLGLNNWKEIKGHTTDKSRWAAALWKIEQCISCDLNIDFCEFLGYEPRVTSWTANQVMLDGDRNFTGYRLNVTFQRTV